MPGGWPTQNTQQYSTLLSLARRGHVLTRAARNARLSLNDYLMSEERRTWEVAYRVVIALTSIIRQLPVR